ncbi:rod shape-determining protein MreC [Lawsonibacter sp. OA9]|uniref:rod shape-determining protein MreC n=1 Tax=Oscillospiraceae TaxID=216572 RepID=UPI001F061D15|nr:MULTISPECIES: rod shape-determining protein MreC [Oscillospiraceae]MCH1978250.1 rod shape-determining protein MreC [Lawsonibacter sp. OA9]MCH1983319.1 rod shape-determining protein MreC [Ruminococcus sp. OA3]
MKKKNRFSIKTKHWIIIMTIVCIGLIALAATSRFSFAPIQQGAGYVISPFQKGINGAGTWLRDQTSGFMNAKKLKNENEALQEKVDKLTEENSNLLQDQEELERLRQLYTLDKEYSEYEKVAAQVISKDPGNWYNTFVINRGSDDGIQVDMNVLANGGLAGIVTEVGKDWATVRSIIDDSSNVSAMVATTSDDCIVTGNLLLMDEGKLNFIQLTDKEDKVQVGDRIVTSNISDKFLKGILIGYIDEINNDTNNLTKNGYLIPVVDFAHIHEVLVIKELKNKGGD